MSRAVITLEGDRSLVEHLVRYVRRGFHVVEERAETVARPGVPDQETDIRKRLVIKSPERQ